MHQLSVHLVWGNYVLIMEDVPHFSSAQTVGALTNNR